QIYLRAPDPALAERYLAATHASIGDYSQLIGPYPFAKFALVENLWESGYGMPSFTLLGPRVIRLPFILKTSYPHEILHNWWGNGVYVDYAQGNWSEGLTTYLADYRTSERAGRGAAHRRDMLRRYADYVSTGADFPLKDFRARHGAPSQSVGYDKGAMVFHMLRRRLGDAAFIAGLRRFYADWQFRVAGFAELRQSFEQASGEDLGDFFSAWTERPGAPRLALGEPRLESTEDGYRLSVRLDQIQNEPPFPIEIPLVIHDASGAARRIWIPNRERSVVLDVSLESKPLRLALDPAFDVFRHLEPGETPLVLSALFGADRGLLVLPTEAAPEEGAAYRQLAEHWRRGRPGWSIRLDRDLKRLPEDRPIWLLGWNNRHRTAVLDGAEDFSLDDSRLRLREGDSGQWIESSLDASSSLVLSRARKGQALAWLGARNSAALPALARKLPHYGNSSYLLFEGAEAHNRLKGQWPSGESALVHWLGTRQ
ncbi:MAG: M1 family peptidase, partial [Chromatiaceae bacterium]|nr:M1 family peptidase [Chromatiaceae bacterium]